MNVANPRAAAQCNCKVLLEDPFALCELGMYRGAMAMRTSNMAGYQCPAPALDFKVLG